MPYPEFGCDAIHEFCSISKIFVDYDNNKIRFGNYVTKLLRTPYENCPYPPILSIKNDLCIKDKSAIAVECILSRPIKGPAKTQVLSNFFHYSNKIIKTECFLEKGGVIDYSLCNFSGEDQNIKAGTKVAAAYELTRINGPLRNEDQAINSFLDLGIIENSSTFIVEDVSRTVIKSCVQNCNDALGGLRIQENNRHEEHRKDFSKIVGRSKVHGHAWFEKARITGVVKEEYLRAYLEKDPFPELLGGKTKFQSNKSPRYDKIVSEIRTDQRVLDKIERIDDFLNRDYTDKFYYKEIALANHYGRSLSSFDRDEF